MSQVRSTFLLFLTQIALKGSSFIRQLLLAFFLGVSRDVDLLIVAQLIPTLIGSVFSGGAGEIMAIQFRSDTKKNAQLIALSTIALIGITILANLLYLVFLPLMIQVIGVEPSDLELFLQLTMFVIISKIPLSVVSSLQQFIYVKKAYKSSLYISLTAEISGLILIVLTSEKIGILSFALALVLSSTINALGYMYLLKINFLVSSRKRIWKVYYQKLKETFYRIAMLGLQTVINQLSSLAERSIGFRYLAEGYIGAMNYAKSVIELPRVVLLSSILTTTYAEQIRLKAECEESYMDYSKKMNDFISTLAFIAQLFSLIFAPFIIIVLFRRGAFDANDVYLTMSIYQVLCLGFVPGLMMGFLSRIMFIEGKNTWMLKATVVKTIVELVLMYQLIFHFNQGIPIALTIGKVFFIVLIFIYLQRNKKGIVDGRKFFTRFGFLFVLSILLLLVNKWIVSYLLCISNFDLLLLYCPILVLFIVFGLKLTIKIHPEMENILSRFKMLRMFLKK